MMLQTIKGIFRDGKVELTEQPTNVTEARVVVVFLPVEQAAQEQTKLTQDHAEARRAAGRRLLALLKEGDHLGGPPYPKREELYDRVNRYGERNG
jgi:hypothetical protein